MDTLADKGNKGGPRVGSGRKPSTANVKTRAIAEKVAADGGKLPLDVMIANMRRWSDEADAADTALLTLVEALDLDEPGEARRLLLAEVKRAAGLRQLAQGAAADASRFMHAILAPVDPETRQSADATPLVDRLKAYATRDAIKASDGKVVALKRGGLNAH